MATFVRAHLATGARLGTGDPQKNSGNSFSKKNEFFSVVRVYACYGALSSPQVRMSPGHDALLSSLLPGVRVEYGVNAGHAEHHIPICGLLCSLVDDVALCLSLIRRAYAFRFSGDHRAFILFSSYPTSPHLLGRVATVYVVPSHNEGSAKRATGILPSSLCFYEQVTMLWEGGLSQVGSHLAGLYPTSH